eukprot:Amastigsp_a694509_4.p2 type:complete len:137 gc:universal Amastigsp_a694509_4:1-411(+)
MGVVARTVPRLHVARLLGVLAARVSESVHLQFVLEWVRALCVEFGTIVRQHAALFAAPLTAVHRAITMRADQLSATANANRNTTAYLRVLLGLGGKAASAGIEPEPMSADAGSADEGASGSGDSEGADSGVEMDES